MLCHATLLRLRVIEVIVHAVLFLWSLPILGGVAGFGWSPRAGHFFEGDHGGLTVPVAEPDVGDWVDLIELQCAAYQDMVLIQANVIASPPSLLPAVWMAKPIRRGDLHQDSSAFVTPYSLAATLAWTELSASDLAVELSVAAEQIGAIGDGLSEYVVDVKGAIQKLIRLGTIINKVADGITVVGEGVGRASSKVRMGEEATSWKTWWKWSDAAANTLREDLLLAAANELFKTIEGLLDHVSSCVQDVARLEGKLRATEKAIAGEEELVSANRAELRGFLGLGKWVSGGRRRALRAAEKHLELLSKLRKFVGEAGDVIDTTHAALYMVKRATLGAEWQELWRRTARVPNLGEHRGGGSEPEEHLRRIWAGLQGNRRARDKAALIEEHAWEHLRIL